MQRWNVRSLVAASLAIDLTRSHDSPSRSARRASTA